MKLLSRFGLVLNAGDQYDNDGKHQHKVFALQTRTRSGRFAKTKLGAVAYFIFRSKHEI